MASFMKWLSSAENLMWWAIYDLCRAYPNKKEPTPNLVWDNQSASWGDHPRGGGVCSCLWISTRPEAACSTRVKWTRVPHGILRFEGFRVAPACREVSQFWWSVCVFVSTWILLRKLKKLASWVGFIRSALGYVHLGCLVLPWPLTWYNYKAFYVIIRICFTLI